MMGEDDLKRCCYDGEEKRRGLRRKERERKELQTRRVNLLPHKERFI